jgi:hypothetical protein
LECELRDPQPFLAAKRFLLRFYRPFSKEARKKEELKLLFRALACSILIRDPNEDEEEEEDDNEWLPFNSMSVLASPLRKKRVFKFAEFYDAMHAACAGDFIFLTSTFFPIRFSFLSRL